MSVFFALMITVLGWSSAFVAIRIGVESYSPINMTFARYLIASILAIGIYKFWPSQVAIKTSDKIRALVCGIIGMGLYSFSLGVGEQTVPASVAGFIVGMMPLCAALCASVLFKELISKRLWIGIILSLVGLTIIALSGHTQVAFEKGLLWVCLGMVCATIYTLAQKPVIKRMPAVPFICYALWGATAFLFVLFCFSSSNFFQEIKHASLASTISVIYQGVVSSILAFLCWTYALNKIHVAKAGIVLYTMPLFTAMLSWLTLGEKPSQFSLIGMGLAFLGSVIGSIKLPAKQPTANSETTTSQQVASKIE